MCRSHARRLEVSGIVVPRSMSSMDADWALRCLRADVRQVSTATRLLGVVRAQRPAGA
jgi:hypothetical protein